MPRMTPIRIDHANRTWSGTWEMDGKDVVVCSAYGSDREPVGRRKPELLAAKLLKEIVVTRGK